jgi:hypothetical protein
MAKVLRCIACGWEGEPPLGASACPACGDRGAPANPVTDADWALTRWQWRLLLTAALLWAARQELESPMMIRRVSRLWRIALAEDPSPDVVHEVVRVAGEVRALIEREETVTARFSTHELRCLTIWASWYVEQSYEPDALIPDRDFEPIMTALRAQQRGETRVPLTIRDEIDELREAGYEVEVHEGQRFEGEDGG